MVARPLLPEPCSHAVGYQSEDHPHVAPDPLPGDEDEDRTAATTSHPKSPAQPFCASVAVATWLRDSVLPPTLRLVLVTATPSPENK